MNQNKKLQETDDVQDRLARLLDEVEALGGGREQRRENLIERAESQGVDRAAAEQAYDLAVEEKLPPAFGLALVGERISVAQFDHEGAAVDASEPVEPEWIDAPPSPEAAERERRLRDTFRRLRSHLESAEGPRAAFESFAREPDLETYEYGDR